MSVYVDELVLIVAHLKRFHRSELVKPVTAAAAGVAFFGEAMSLWTFSGMGLVLLGIFITSR